MFNSWSLSPGLAFAIALFERRKMVRVSECIREIRFATLALRINPIKTFSAFGWVSLDSVFICGCIHLKGLQRPFWGILPLDIYYNISSQIARNLSLVFFSFLVCLSLCLLSCFLSRVARFLPFVSLFLCLLPLSYVSCLSVWCRFLLFFGMFLGASR